MSKVGATGAFNEARPMSLGTGKAGDDWQPLVAGDEYELVAAGANAQPLGANGALGDHLAGVLIVPASTSPGAVQIKDGGDAAVTIFAGGASSVGSLVPFFVPLGIKSRTGPWQITTGPSVSAIGVGDFT